MNAADAILDIQTIRTQGEYLKDIGLMELSTLLHAGTGTTATQASGSR